MTHQAKDAKKSSKFRGRRPVAAAEIFRFLFGKLKGEPILHTHCVP